MRLFKGVVSQVGMQLPEETATFTPINLVNMGHAASWLADPATNWPEYTSATTENEMYIGSNQSGWWNLTTYIAFPINIQPGAKFTRARLRLYHFAKGANIDSVGYNVDVTAVLTANSTPPTTGANFTTWANSGRVKVGDFQMTNSSPATMDWFDIELNPSYLTTVLALPGWSSGNMVAHSLQHVPPVQPGTTAMWATFRTGRSPNATFMPQLLVDFNGYFGAPF